MVEDLKLTVLADNCVSVSDLLAEHGLSILVETDSHRILFDTGQGKVLFPNARTLNCDLGSLDAIVISHGHYDHTGGLARILRAGNRPRVYLHPAAVARKFAKRNDRPTRYVGIPEDAKRELSSAGGRAVWTRTAAEIVPDVWCTGEIPRVFSPEGSETAFFLDEECRETDPVADDQALYVLTNRGVVVVAGCSHAGVANTLDYVARLSGADRIYALMGGLHLGFASRTGWTSATDAIRRRNVQVIAPSHCTGIGAQAHLRATFPSQVVDVSVGSRFRLDAQ